MPTEPGNYADVRIGEIALERTDAGIAVLTISGEHDLNTAPDLRRRLGELIDGGTSVVVDLSPATFVDSTILGMILDARRQAVERGRGFAVAHAGGEGEAVARVLEITGLREELPVHRSRQDALRDASTPVGGEGA
jgi:anti-sigma B factor antagonist